MVGYDTSYKRDEYSGYTLSVFMHWNDDEHPPKNRIDALKRLKNTINSLEPIIKEVKKKDGC